MGLAGFERALAAMVASPRLVAAVLERPETALAGHDLDAREHRRLVAIAGQPGLHTCVTLARARRLAAIDAVFPRTCNALGERALAVLDAACDGAGELAAAVAGFVAIVVATMDRERDHDAFVLDVLRFELALQQLVRPGPPGPRRRLVRLQHDVAAVCRLDRRPGPPRRRAPCWVLMQCTARSVEITPLTPAVGDVLAELDAEARALPAEARGLLADEGLVEHEPLPW